MRNELSDCHRPPLSTRMIFLHHRVRMHDQASRHGAHEDGTVGTSTSPIALTVFAVIALAAAMLLGIFHA